MHVLLKLLLFDHEIPYISIALKFMYRYYFINESIKKGESLRGIKHLIRDDWLV